MRYLLVLIVFLIACSSNEGKVRVAIASSFHPAFKDIKALYDSTHLGEMDLIVASSGQIATQVVHGAPFDVFISADEDYYSPVKGKLPIKESYLRGFLALASNDSLGIIDSLFSNQYSVVAYPNSSVAPYGVLAEKYLQGKKIECKIVKGESVSHVNQFLSSRNVVAALTSYSSVKNHDFKIVVFEELFLENFIFAADNDRGEELLQFLKSEKVMNILYNHGYK